jgi:hypothetical protein
MAKLFKIVLNNKNEELIIADDMSAVIYYLNTKTGNSEIISIMEIKGVFQLTGYKKNRRGENE